jgi:hypothetical protein
VLVYLPAKRMMRKPADVRVVVEGRGVERLETWERSRSRRVESLNDAHERLWRFTVYVHPDEQEKRKMVEDTVAGMIGKPSRYEIDE